MVGYLYLVRRADSQQCAVDRMPDATAARPGREDVAEHVLPEVPPDTLALVRGRDPE
jgi:hypothetical protein